jgi:hypothetical protein
MSGPKSLLQLMDEKANSIRESKGLPAAPAKSQVFTEKDQQSMNVVFNQLMQIFPGHKKQFSREDDFDKFKAQFIKGLLDSKIRRREQFEKAFRKARERIYPTLPTIGEFLSWCKREPDDYGYPTCEQALWEVLNRYKDINPASRLAGRKTRYERGTMKADEYEQVFSEVYCEIVFDAVDNGRDLAAEIARAIESKPTKKESSADIAQSSLESMKCLFGKSIAAKSAVGHESDKERRARIIEKKLKMGFSLSDDDKKFMESMKK